MAQMKKKTLESSGVMYVFVNSKEPNIKLVCLSSWMSVQNDHAQAFNIKNSSKSRHNFGDV